MVGSVLKIDKRKSEKKAKFLIEVYFLRSQQAKQLQSIVDARVNIQCLQYLGYITLGSIRDNYCNMIIKNVIKCLKTKTFPQLSKYVVQMQDVEYE